MAAEKHAITLDREFVLEARPTPSALRVVLVFGGLLAAGLLFALVAPATPQAAAGIEPAGVYLSLLAPPPPAALMSLRTV